MAESIEFEELLAGLAGGDDEVARRFCRDFEPQLRMIVRRHLPHALRSKFDSSDIVQGLWCELLKGFGTRGWHFANGAQFRAFMLKVAHDRVVDLSRHFRVEVARGRAIGESPDEPAAPAGASAEETAQAEELWEKMLRLCPTGHRALLMMKREGVSAEEIAQRTGLHATSVRRILARLACQLSIGPE